MAEGRPALKVALVNDYELVLRGLESLLAPYPDRVVVVELTTDHELGSTPDVVLVDTFARPEGTRLEVDHLRGTTECKVVIYSWHTDVHQVEAALKQGADGCLAKSMSGLELVEALERVAAGHRVVPEAGQHLDADLSGSWPGQCVRLTAREAEIVALIAQGLSNREIADRAFLSVNSVKSHIRTGYRKMGVTRRSQAVVWALNHGFATSSDLRSTEVRTFPSQDQGQTDPD
jgi:NarL family two-component system response regulator LiaR